MEVIPDVSRFSQGDLGKVAAQAVMFKDELASYQLVGGVMAYQGF